MTVTDRALEVARKRLGLKESTPNNADWLRALMEEAGNPCGWSAPQPYCISAALACFQIALKEAGTELPLDLCSRSTQTFYARAEAHGFVVGTPRIGSIAVFRLGKENQGHAEPVFGVDPAFVDTIGFNTSGSTKGSQRNGEGVFIKRRTFSHFKKSDHDLWLRGFVNLPGLDLVIPEGETKNA